MFFTAGQRVIFTSCPLLPAMTEDVLPASLLSNVVYNFSCPIIVGTCTAHLNDYRTKFVNTCQKFIRTGQIPNSRNISTSFGKSLTRDTCSVFAIGRHLLDNPMCG